MQLALAVKKAKRTFLCGNGGSAATAIHIANDLTDCGVRATALTADVATLTRIANDVEYAEVFAQQLRTLAEPGDLLIALSGSGNSINILRALEIGRKLQMRTWVVTGNYQPVGKAVPLAENNIRRGANMQLAEEAQLAVGHEIMRWLKRNS